jgi:thymidylate synthase (FAD)
MAEIVQPTVIFEDEVNGEEILTRLERYARVCYKSEDKTGPGTAVKLLASIIKRGHESVLEHEKITVRVICNRGVTHEWVRHRIGSYSQESTRFCNYGTKGVKFIDPFFFKGESNKAKYQIWLQAMEATEAAYLKLLELGASPQEARDVLPNALKTEIVVTFNIRQWRHFFRLRCSKAAHPQMREITIPLLKQFQAKIPFLFDDIRVDA